MKYTLPVLLMLVLGVSAAYAPSWFDNFKSTTTQKLKKFLKNNSVVAGIQAKLDSYEHGVKTAVVGALITQVALTAGFICLGFSVLAGSTVAIVLTTLIAGGVSIFGLYTFITGLLDLKQSFDAQRIVLTATE